MFCLCEIVTFLFSKWILGILFVFLLFYKWATNQNDFFIRKGIPFVTPKLLFGSFRSFVFQKESLFDIVGKVYNFSPTSKIVGFFQFKTPIYMIRDPELIKQIAIKDFDHFSDRNISLDENSDPLFGRSLFMLNGSRWRDMRATLSPAFTSNKMRTMFQLIVTCAENLREHLIDKSKTEIRLELELKELFSRFATDVIASCAFGIDINSLENPNNEFYEMGKIVTNLGGIRGLIMLGHMNFPSLLKLLKLTIFPKTTHEFFRSLVMDSMKYRDEHHIQRPDMINILMKVRKGIILEEKDTCLNDLPSQETDQLENPETEFQNSKRVWEDDDLTAQCLLFFLAGLESGSSVVSFAGYQLAIHQEIQQKLLKEIDRFNAILNGNSLDYENLREMTYLDVVVSETLRMSSTAPFLDRKCTKAYDLNYDGKTLRLDPGDVLWLPVHGLHNDPEHFNEPSAFNPDRFSEENKKSIKPGSFCPFGIGPRNCLGARFAQMETKAVLFYILTKFTFEISDITQIPIEYKKGGFIATPEKGFWIYLKPRT